MFIEWFGFYCLACFTYQNEMLIDSSAGWWQNESAASHKMVPRV